MADSSDIQETPRPSIKIRTPLPTTDGTAMSASPAQTSATAMSPPPITPTAGNPGVPAPRKSIIKITKRTPSTSGPSVAIAPGPAPALPADDAPLPPILTKTLKGRISKPSAKKRAKTDADPPVYGTEQAKKVSLIKLKKNSGIGKAARQVSIAVKTGWSADRPVRTKGEGYDSAEDEREDDPVIEEQIILRMLPGEHLDYLRQMVKEHKVGKNPKEGGAEFSLKWITNNDRRALITIKHTHFAAVLVDLPTITESMKTWDKKNFMKSADICQMLLVFARVASEAEARIAPLPKMVNKDLHWPHGLTPPMHDCRHRRFRKRLSKKEIKDKEAELKRLLAEDREALSTSYEWVDDGIDRPMQPGQNDSGLFGEDFDGDEDAEGEDDDMADEDVDEDDLEALLLAGLNDAEGEDDIVMAETPAQESGTEPATADGATPAAASEGDESSESDEDDDDDEEDDEKSGIRNDIIDLKKQLELLKAQYAANQNIHLKTRIEGNIKKMKEELRLKQSQVGEVDDDD